MPNSVCLDANLVFHLISGKPLNEAETLLWQRWEAGGAVFVAPSLLMYEISNALHRYVLYGHMLPEEATRAFERALALGIRLYGDPDLHRRALAVAQRFHLPGRL